MTPYTHESDSTLVELCRRGEQAAYEELVTRYERAVKGTACKMLGNRTVAEDASQDAFLSAWIHLGKLRDPARFGPWVCAIAKNQAKRLAARERQSVPDLPLHELENLDLEGSERESGIAAALARADDYAELYHAVDALSETLRETVRLHYFEGLSVKDIAAQLSVAEGTVKWRLSEGRQQLRKEYGMMEHKTENTAGSLSDRVMQSVKSWEALTLEARQGYTRELENGWEALVDVRPAAREAVTVAETPRERRHAHMAAEVMERIMDTDPEINPAYTEKGRWNFFEYERITREGGEIKVSDDRRYSFEWKEMWGDVDDRHPLLHSFFDAILYDGLGCIWSDEWEDGYRLPTLARAWTETIAEDIRVSGGETVITPAGTFEGCRHLSFFEHYGNAGAAYCHGLHHYWFADGIGIVQYMHAVADGREIVWHLTHCDGIGTGYFPLEDGLFRRYEPTSLPAGWHGSVEYTVDASEADGSIVLFRNTLGTQDREAYEADLKKAN